MAASVARWIGPIPSNGTPRNEPKNTRAGSWAAKVSTKSQEPSAMNPSMR
jgi:hypothetical protein